MTHVIDYLLRFHYLKVVFNLQCCALRLCERHLREANFSI